MRRKIQAAMLEWKTEVSARQCLLQSAPSVGIYNGIIEDIRAETFELTLAIGTATEEYEESHKTTGADIEKMRVRFLNELQLMIESAISRFIDDASTSLYAQFGDSPEVVPFMANTAGVASNFRSITQCVTMMLTLMPEDIQHELSVAELDMFSTLARVLPSLCPIPGKSGLPPAPDEGLGDLVSSQTVSGSDRDKEKVVTSTSADTASRPAGDRSRSSTPVHSREGSQPPASKRMTPPTPFSIGLLLNSGSRNTTLSKSGGNPKLMVRQQENATLLKVQSALKSQFSASSTSSANPKNTSTSPVGTPAKKLKLSHYSSVSEAPKPRMMVKALAAEHGVNMVTNQLAEPATGSQDYPDDLDEDLTLVDDEVEVDFGEEDDDDDDEIRYVKTTQCEFPPPKNRSSRSASSSAPPASATETGLSSFSQVTPSTSSDRAPTSTATRGRGGKSTKTTRKSSKKAEPTLTPEEELAASRTKGENRDAARIIFHNNDLDGIKDI